MQAVWLSRNDYNPVMTSANNSPTASPLIAVAASRLPLGRSRSVGSRIGTGSTLLHLLLLIGIALAFAACASRRPSPAPLPPPVAVQPPPVAPAPPAPPPAPAPPPPTPPEVVPDFFASDDFVVVTSAKPGDTAESLATQYLGSAAKAWMIEEYGGTQSVA